MFPDRSLKLFSDRKDMIIAKLYLASLHMVDLLHRVYTMLILISVIPLLTPARDTPSVPKTAKEIWNLGLLPTSSWWTVVDAPLCRKFVMPSVRGLLV